MQGTCLFGAACRLQRIRLHTSLSHVDEHLFQRLDYSTLSWSHPHPCYSTGCRVRISRLSEGKRCAKTTLPVFFSALTDYPPNNTPHLAERGVYGGSRLRRKRDRGWRCGSGQTSQTSRRRVPHLPLGRGGWPRPDQLRALVLRKVSRPFLPPGRGLGHEEECVAAGRAGRAARAARVHGLCALLFYAEARS